RDLIFSDDVCLFQKPLGNVPGRWFLFTKSNSQPIIHIILYPILYRLFFVLQPTQYMTLFYQSVLTYSTVQWPHRRNSLSHVRKQYMVSRLYTTFLPNPFHILILVQMHFGALCDHPVFHLPSDDLPKRFVRSENDSFVHRLVLLMVCQNNTPT